VQGDDKMAKRKIIPIVVVLIVAFIAGQFNAFGSLAKLTGKIVVTVKATIKRISRILVVKEKDTEEVVEIKAQKAKTVSTPAKVEENAPIPEQLMNSMREKRLENDDWEDGTLLYNFLDDTNDDFYQEPEYDDVDVEPSDDWDSLLESLTIEIFSDEGYSEYLDANDEDVNNEDGIQRCNFILSAVGTVTTVMDLVEIANDYFAKSRKFFDKADYERAELYAKMALDIYVNVGNADNAIKCDEFLQEIRERINEIKRDAAYQYYSTAIEFLEAGLFENATESATRARTIYLEINDDEGISQCNSLIQEIINRGCLVQADEFYSMAEDYYNSGMYENSSTYAEIAFGIYSKINNSNGMEKSALLRDKSQKYLDAGIYLELAQKYFSEGNYDNATKQVEMAKSIYSELNDPERIADCDSLVSKIEEKKLGSLILNVALFFFVIAIVVILLLVFFRGSKHKKPEETKVESQGSAESK